MYNKNVGWTINGPDMVEDNDEGKLWGGMSHLSIRGEVCGGAKSLTQKITFPFEIVTACFGAF